MKKILLNDYRYEYVKCESEITVKDEDYKKYENKEITLEDLVKKHAIDNDLFFSETLGLDEIIKYEFIEMREI